MSCFAVHKKLRAFTLLELLVGMIVSGIVLTATFSAYRIVSHQNLDYSARSKSATDLSFFMSRFAVDFSAKGKVYRLTENEISFEQEKRKLLYRFSEKNILRSEEAHTDTFFVAAIAVSSFFESIPVDGENQEADELHLRLLTDGQKEDAVFTKGKSAKNKMDREEESILRELK